jgi:hypothetical protein
VKEQWEKQVRVRLPSEGAWEKPSTLSVEDAVEEPTT